MSPRSTPDAPRKREADPRQQRYTQAKQAAAKLEAAKVALSKALERETAAALAFDASVDAAETPEERAFLETLAPKDVRRRRPSVADSVSVGSGEPTA